METYSDLYLNNNAAEISAERVMDLARGGILFYRRVFHWTPKKPTARARVGTRTTHLSPRRPPQCSPRHPPRRPTQFSPPPPPPPPLATQQLKSQAQVTAQHLPRRPPQCSPRHPPRRPTQFSPPPPPPPPLATQQLKSQAQVTAQHLPRRTPQCSPRHPPRRPEAPCFRPGPHHVVQHNARQVTHHHTLIPLPC
jgi:hypothetical protein